MHLLILPALLLTGPAQAREPAHPAPHAAEAGHAPEAAHAEDAHAEGAHHVTYTDDDDGDGIPNWRDSTNGDQDNTESYVLSSLGFHALNLLLLFGLLFWFMRRPVIDLFRDRALGIRKELTDSARRRDEAHQRHHELVARLEKIEAEVVTMNDEAAKDAAQEEASLIERAEREAVRIAEQSQRTIRDETTRARTALRREAVELAVQLAEATLRSQVSQTDQQALARDFLDSLKSEDGDAQHGG